METQIKETGYYCHHCFTFLEKDDEEVSSQSPFVEKQDDESEVAFIICPSCGKPAVEVGLHFRGIAKMNKNKLQTGPITEKGKKKMAEMAKKNLHGPNTEEGKRRSSKNRWTHGRYSKKMKELCPASYNKYHLCTECDEDTKTKCKNKEISWCPLYISKQLNFYALHVNKDVRGLADFAAENLSRLAMILEMAYGSIFKEGLVVKDTYEHEFGTNEIIKPNPAAEYIFKAIEALGQTSNQQGTNPKAEKEEQAVDGFLKQTDVSDITNKMAGFNKLKKFYLAELTELSVQGKETKEKESDSESKK